MKYIFILILILSSLLFAGEYPNKTITITVPFSQGGSTDRLARTMQPFLEEEFKQTVTIVNKKGQGTLFGTSSFLKDMQEGHHILLSSFSPYIPNTILANNTPYSIDDFEILNIQWFDFEFIAVNQHSPYSTILDLIQGIKKSQKPFKVAVLHRSTGYLIVKLLMEKFDINNEKVKFVLFHGGKGARESLITQDVDFLVISAQGSEKYREFLKPLAIIKEKRSKRWDAPTLNEALKPTGISLPIFKGSMRGLAVSKELKESFPSRYNYLRDSLKKILSKRKVQHELKKHKMGYTWIGPEKSNQLLKESYELFKTYDYLHKN